MIDIHSHLLPGVDDGSRSIEQSVLVLERFAADGVELLVCTPHLDASMAHAAPVERNRALLAELVERAPAAPRLALGFEIMLDAPGVDLTAPGLALAGSRAVLVEFPLHGAPPRADRELARLRESGVVPVVAHPERYRGCTPDDVRAWRAAGAVIQMDATMLLSGSPVAALARTLLEEGLVDCMASDNHGDRRTLAAARDWLVELGAEEEARLLTAINAGRLLAGEPMLPVAPIPRASSMLGRLRELMFGGRGRAPRSRPR